MESVNEGGEGSESLRGSKLRREWVRVGEGPANLSSFLYQP